MKLPSPSGSVITLKVDQKAARKCYENSLKTQRGSYTIVTSEKLSDIEADPRMDQRERRPEPVGEVREIDINGRKFKVGESVGETFEKALREVLSRNMSAFAWSTADMPGIDLDFLSHRLMVDP